MIRVIVVDDEPSARENIIIRLAHEQNIDVCAQADNGHDALLLASKLQPDVIFLDIKMPGMNGLQAAEQLKEHVNSMLIFVTAFDEHAVEAFRTNALDYLLKPINDQHFSDTIKRIHANFKLRNSVRLPIQTTTSDKYLKRLGIKDGQTISMINVNDIETIETAGDYLCIRSMQNTFVHRQTLKSLMAVINPEIFIRIHRFHVVNITFVKQLLASENGYFLILLDKRQLSISRRYQKEVKSKVSNFLNILE